MLLTAPAAVEVPMRRANQDICATVLMSHETLRTQERCHLTITGVVLYFDGGY